MNNLVCIDTQIMIWGIRKSSRPEQTEMIHRAVSFFEKMHKTSAKIIIPSPSIGEYLFPVDASEHSRAVSSISKNFIVASYDAKAAMLCAQIFQKVKQNGTWDEMKQDNTITRNHLKVDMMIVAIAQSVGAIQMYSNDQHIHKISKGIIPCSILPNAVSQLPFPNL